MQPANNWICPNHGEPITKVCLYDHNNCKRKLCDKCIYGKDDVKHEHNGKILLVDDVKDIVLPILKQLRDEYQMQIGLNSLSLKKLKELGGNIARVITALCDEAKSLHDKISNLNEEVLDVQSFLDSEEYLWLDQQRLDKIVNLSLGKPLEFHQHQLKEVCTQTLSQIFEIVDSLQGRCSELQTLTLKSNFTEILQDGIQFEYSEQFGYRKGDCYYRLKDGSKKYAGKYEYNLKQGSWLEYKGSEIVSDKKYHFIPVEYNNGKQIEPNNTRNTCRCDQKNQKSGQWVINCGKTTQLLEVGNYDHGKKEGEWVYKYQGNQIGNGNYNSDGYKHGTWVEPLEQYTKGNELTFTGEYCNGVKSGEWIYQLKQKPIGGGNYDDNGKKQGLWIELFENYNSEYQVTYKGQYKDGVKIGQWETCFQEISIGGGIYDGKGLKQGEWTDLHNYYWGNNKVIFCGKYTDGFRSGFWNTLFNGAKIGGGKYDNLGLKTDQWVDVPDNYNEWRQITERGEYQNGVRIGKWTQHYQHEYESEEIGGGEYDSNGIKIGQWTDIEENYNPFCQVTYKGEYQIGIRNGVWEIIYKSDRTGWGEYDERGLKQNSWKELHQNFKDKTQLTIFGLYQNGIRTGEWTIEFKGFRIGGGSYDEKGRKIGEWVDVSSEFEDNNQKKVMEIYENGKLVKTSNIE